MKKFAKRLSQYLLLPLLVVATTTLQAQTPPAPDKVLARNQRTSVTVSDFEAELARIPQKDRFEVLQDREKVAMLIDNLLINKTLAIEARENKLDALPHVQAEIANQTDKVLAKYRGQQVQTTLPKTDLLPRARERYLTSPEKFTTQELHDIWHVLVSNKGRTREQARARAEEVEQKLLAGEPREKLALAYSDDDTSKMNKGNIGPYNIGEFDPRFAKTVKGMKLGDVAITESSFGIHVVKLLDKIPSIRHSFESAKAELLYEAETEYVIAAWNNYLRNIRSDPKLFVDIDALESLRPKLPEIPPLQPALPAGRPAAAATSAPNPAKN